MQLTLERLRKLIKEMSLDPFTDGFNIRHFNKLVKSFNDPNESALATIELLNVCNKMYRDSKKRIHSSFNQLMLQKKDIETILFQVCNNQHISTSKSIYDYLIHTENSTVEDLRFLKVQNEIGEDIRVDTISETQVDIVAELLIQLETWNEEGHSDIEVDYGVRLLIILRAFQAASAIISLRDECFKLVVYYKCIPEWVDKATVRIFREQPVIGK